MPTISKSRVDVAKRGGSRRARHPGRGQRVQHGIGQREFFRYPDSQIPEEHLYVPRPGSEPESGGWILGTAFDWRRGAQVINLFDAERVADGPMASAELPYAIPLGLHGKFVAG